MVQVFAVHFISCGLGPQRKLYCCTPQLYCCRGVVVLSLRKFDEESLTFDEVLTGIWRNLENSPINGRKVSFWHYLPSNTSKSMKKEVLREIFINMYDMGV